MKKKMMLKNAALLSALSLGAAATANAGDIQWNGFISGVAGMTSASDERYLGYDDTIGFKPDSTFGLQASSDLGDGLGITAQLVGRGADSFDAEFEWAYLSYDVTPEWQAKLGKIRIPFYLYTDYLEVGYAYHWMRAPSLSYNVEFSTIEGLNMQQRTALGSWDSDLQLVAGRYQDSLELGEFDIQNIYGVAWALSRDWFTVRLAYFQADVLAELSDQGDVAALKGAIDSFTLANAQLGSEFALDNDRGTFKGVALKAEQGGWLAVAEWNEVGIEDSVYNFSTNWYISVAKRIDALQLHVTYEESESEFEHDPARLVAGSGALEAGVRGLMSQLEGEADTVTVGARYDFHPRAALKVEYSDISNEIDGDAKWFGLGIDVIF